MSKLTCALAVAASLVSIVTGVVLLSQEVLAQEVNAAPSAAAAVPDLKAQMAANLSPDQARGAARDALKARLEALTGFSARFKQELTDGAGNVLSEGSGELFLLRPDHFLMHNQSPDDLAFYTKGSDLYYYDAAVNQLSISSLDALGSNPLMLLADVNNVSWDEYEVRRDGEFFTLVPLHAQDVKSLTLAFGPEQDGVAFLTALTIRMDDGNTNFYLFSEQSTAVDPTVFDLELPADVEVDDMR